MKRSGVVVALVAVALGGGCMDQGAAAVDEPDAMPPPPPEHQVVLCREVGAAFCQAQMGCRFSTPVDDCKSRWENLHCVTPEQLTDEGADACASAWTAAGTDCTTWWASNWWVNTAPSCAAMTRAH